MSIRPQEAAESASRFSLRQVFSSADAPPASFARAPQPQLQPQASQPQASQPQAGAHPAFGAAHPAPAGLAMSIPMMGATSVNVSGNSGLKFTLPKMRGGQPAPVVPVGTHASRNLEAGFLNGGTPHTTQETLRLNGIIADLHAKLATSQERLATAERAVARGARRRPRER